MDLFMRIFTIGTVTLKQGEIKDATPLDFVRATATIPIQASLPFGWLSWRCTSCCFSERFQNHNPQKEMATSTLQGCSLCLQLAVVVCNSLLTPFARCCWP